MSTAVRQLEHRLSAADASRARVVALARIGQNLALHRPNTDGGRYAIGQHIDGARAELAFLRMIGADLAQWAAYTNTSRSLAAIGADVAGWEVRSTRHRDGHLLVHPRDVPGTRMALVTTNGVLYRAPGWIMAEDGRRPEWWRELSRADGACWCVPQSALRPFP